MAKKALSVYVCNNCDSQFPKWMGQCTECGKWGTIEEQASEADAPVALQERKQALQAVKAAQPQAFGDIDDAAHERISTGIDEVDRVLGGGFVAGEFVLLGGDPGIGKSTLVAQIAAGVLAGAARAQSATPSEVLYVSGEESGQQIAMRLKRMGIPLDGLLFLPEQHIEVVCKTAAEKKPALLIVDSIQTVASSHADGEPGSVNQLKASAVRLLELAKSSNIPVLIIGHVTKGGELGGPKTLEHIVDAVLYLEGDRFHQYRMLRAVKNRFGATNEVGVFEMQQQGLQPVENASQVFVRDRSNASGSVMTSVSEGSRVFFVEVQALVNRTTFGYPQRKSSGFDSNRLNVLLAVLQRRVGLPLDTHDVYINVVGGMKFVDTAMDAAVCLAIASAIADISLDAKTVAWGEVGLAGEVRSVSRQKDREKEAKRFGMTTVLSAETDKTVQELIAKAGITLE